MFAYAHRCVFRALADFFAMIRTPRYKRLIGTVVGHNDHFDRLRYNHFRLSYQTSTVKYVFSPFVAQTIWISFEFIGQCWGMHRSCKRSAREPRESTSFA